MASKWNRRNFLKGTMALGGAYLTASLGRPQHGLTQMALASGAAISDRYFIFCYFSGGWDLLISLDPRDPAQFREDLKKVTRIQPAFHMLPSDYRELVPSTVPGMVFGPYIGNLVKHADKMSIVRGMSMDTLTHEVGRRRFITGKQPSGLQARGSSLATVMAAQLGGDAPIANLSVGVESYNEDQPDFATAIRVTSVTDLVRALRPAADAVSESERAAINELLNHFRDCPTGANSAFRTRGYGANAAAQNLVAGDLSGLFDFTANTPEMEAIRDRYDIDPRDMSSGEAQAAMAVTALSAGISRCVSIEAARDLDAHGPAWAYGHGPKLERGFNVVSAMIDDLSTRQYKDTGDTWLDHTTVVIFSEFSRTGLVNASGGRDHSLTNACILLGAGIREGQLIGSSSDVGLAPVAADLATGESRAPGEGTIIKPEHVHRALMHSVGISEDIVGLRADPLMALLR